MRFLPVTKQEEINKLQNILPNVTPVEDPEEGKTVKDIINDEKVWELTTAALKRNTEKNRAKKYNDLLLPLYRADLSTGNRYQALREVLNSIFNTKHIVWDIQVRRFKYSPKLHNILTRQQVTLIKY